MKVYRLLNFSCIYLPFSQNTISKFTDLTEISEYLNVPCQNIQKQNLCIIKTELSLRLLIMIHHLTWVEFCDFVPARKH